MSDKTYSGADAGSRERDDSLRRDEDTHAKRLEREYPGAGAEKPTEIPKKGWWQIVRRGLKEFSADQMPLMAAGVAFYAFLSLVPTLIAATLVYGLVTSPEDVKRQIQDLSSVLPQEAATLVGQQMTDLASAKSTGLGIGLVISLALALWSASGGTGILLTAVNVAYDEKETRNFVKKRGLALMLTVGAIIVFVLTASLVAVFPAVANALGVTGIARVGLEALRWIILLVVLMAALAVLYRLAPDRDDPKFKWTSVGAVVAILLGAEVNAETEKQTVKDTTTGPDKPLGERDAVKADLTPSQPDPDPETLKKR